MGLAVEIARGGSVHKVQTSPAPDFSRRVFCIQGLLCDAVTLQEAEQKLIASIKTARRCNLVTPNTNFLRISRSDARFRDALLACDLSVFDGAPLVWLAWALGIAVPGRVCGSDLCAALMGHRTEHFRAFFFGATDEAGQRVRERLESDASSLTCAGAYAPGFGSIASMSDPQTLDRINGANPDLLIVSVGARKGVLWLDQNEARLSAPVICYLGAVVHFVAGTVKRAPHFFRRHGLEWLWRIKEEPALCMRYALDLATLASILVGRILPCAVDRAIRKPSAESLTEARVQHERLDSAEVLEFSGPWTCDNLAPARSALSAATASKSNLIVDLENTTFVDPAFLGQILIAYGYQRRMRRGFLLRASRWQVRRMLRLHGCSYLIAAGRQEAGSP